MDIVRRHIIETNTIYLLRRVEGGWVGKPMESSIKRCNTHRESTTELLKFLFESNFLKGIDYIHPVGYVGVYKTP